MGRHLLFTNWRVTHSEASLPTLPKIAFVDRLNERLALVTEHLNCRPLIMYVPKYRISLTQGRLWPFMVDMLAHLTSHFTSLHAMLCLQLADGVWPSFIKRITYLLTYLHLGPVRIQHDFLMLTHISKQDNSNSQAWKRRCNSLTDGAMSSAYITTTS